MEKGEGATGYGGGFERGRMERKTGKKKARDRKGKEGRFEQPNRGYEILFCSLMPPIFFEEDSFL